MKRIKVGASFGIGLCLYCVDSLFIGVVSHLNAMVHEAGHYSIALLSGTRVNSVSIGSGGALLFPQFSIGSTTVQIYRSAAQSYVDGGVSPSVSFYLGGPLISIAFGLLILYMAKSMTAKSGKWWTVATVFLCIVGMESLIGRGVINLIPINPRSDGARIIALVSG